MASALEREATTRRWRRVEYERLVDLGMFVGERLELLDGVLLVREPQGSPHAAIVAKVGQVLAVAFGDRWHPRLHSPLALGEHSELCRRLQGALGSRRSGPRRRIGGYVRVPHPRSSTSALPGLPDPR
jgi:hypothetical protein